MKALRGWVQKVVRPIALTLAGWGITANMVTIAAFFLNAGVALVIALGYEQWGGLLVLVVGAMDTLDGAIARATNTVTRFGAFLDSNLDRYSEAVIFLGIVVLYSQNPDQKPDSTIIVALTYVAAVGSFMVSYARARAQGLGLDCEVGLLPRPERVLILGLGLLTGLVLPALAILALLTNLTALQRIWYIRQKTR